MDVSKLLTYKEIATKIEKACKERSFNFKFGEARIEEKYINEECGIKFSLFMVESTPNDSPYYDALPDLEVFLVKDIETVINILRYLDVLKKDSSNNLLYHLEE